MPSKVSIIIGCYNVAKWIHQGRLNDIFCQTYTNWELILVDDGSTDDTPALLDAEAKKDSRIIVIHKENGGLGSARNAGLDVATGEYIWSFDLDDHVDLDCIEYCVQEIEQRKVDVLMFGFYAITPQFETKETIQLQETMTHTSEELRNVYLDRILFIPNGNGFFWNKFYRRSFIEEYKFRFSTQRIQQDEYFNLLVYEKLEKCYISPRVFYHYYIYNTGNNRSRFYANRFEFYKSIYCQFRNLQTHWDLYDDRFKGYLLKRLYNNTCDCILSNMFHPDCSWSNEEKKQQLNSILSDTDVQSAIEYCKNSLSFESKVYLGAIMSRNLCYILMSRNFFSILRNIKNRIC